MSGSKHETTSGDRHQGGATLTRNIPEILAAHAMWVNDPTTGARANLRGANLSWADLSGANLRRADLSGAHGYRCLGWDRRGYHFRAVRTSDGWQVTAGCRNFALPEAVAHWTAAGNGDALARLSILTDPTVAVADASPS